MHRKVRNRERRSAARVGPARWRRRSRSSRSVAPDWTIGTAVAIGPVRPALLSVAPDWTIGTAVAIGPARPALLSVAPDWTIGTAAAIGPARPARGVGDRLRPALRDQRPHRPAPVAVRGRELRFRDARGAGHEAEQTALDRRAANPATASACAPAVVTAYRMVRSAFGARPSRSSLGRVPTTTSPTGCWKYPLAQRRSFSIAGSTSGSVSMTSRTRFSRFASTVLAGAVPTTTPTAEVRPNGTRTRMPGRTGGMGPGVRQAGSRIDAGPAPAPRPGGSARSQFSTGRRLRSRASVFGERPSIFAKAFNRGPAAHCGRDARDPRGRRTRRGPCRGASDATPQNSEPCTRLRVGPLGARASCPLE